MFHYSEDDIVPDEHKATETARKAWAEVESYQVSEDDDQIRDLIASGLANERVLAALFLIQTGDSDSADRVFRSALKGGDVDGSDAIPDADDPLGWFMEKTEDRLKWSTMPLEDLVKELPRIYCPGFGLREGVDWPALRFFVQSIAELNRVNPNLARQLVLEQVDLAKRHLFPA